MGLCSPPLPHKKRAQNFHFPDTSLGSCIFTLEPAFIPAANLNSDSLTFQKHP